MKFVSILILSTAIRHSAALASMSRLTRRCLAGRRSGGKRGRGAPNKIAVLGMLERDRDVMTRIVANVKRVTLEPHIVETIIPGSTVSTDELRSYARLTRFGYDHESVNHASDEFVRGKNYVNTAECFWTLLKRSIKGTHVHISRAHLAKYFCEFEFRWNLRKHPALMFPLLRGSL
jgi:transposase-like protein